LPLLAWANGGRRYYAATTVEDEHAVKTHMEHILQKLDLHDRTQVVVVA
jgi:hypothetical protein